MTDTLSRPGQKAVISDEGVADGWLAPFDGPVKGGKDLDGEFFSAKTDFGLDYYPTIPILYGHGQDGEIGAAKVGEISLKEIRDKGLWVQGQLDRQGKYYDVLRELADKGDLYWSSGSLSHLVVKDARTGAIKQWPVAEATLTLTPANPWATASVKEATPEPPDDFEVTVTYSLKEGRRHAAVDERRLATIHQLLAELGTPEPEVEPQPAGKSPEVPPAPVLAIKAGNDVEQPSAADLAALKESLRALAIAEVRRLTG